jgi:hypothetical protein
MTEQTSGTPGGNAAGGSPGGETPSGNTGTRSFIAARSAQIQERMQQPAQDEHGEQPASDAGQQGQQQQQAPAAEQKIRVGDAEYDAADLQSAIAERAEAQVRRSGLPSAPEGYEVKNSAGFQLPEGIAKFEFDMRDPTLAAARKFALTNNLTQEQFSGMLDLFVASKSGELLNQVRAREANLAALGAAGSQRVESVATWLQARAGGDGRAVGNFLRQYPSAPIVKAMESLMRAFSSQGGADFSQSHRDQAEEAGKIPGFENMNFIQRRVWQMTQAAQRPRGGDRRGE